MSASEDKRLARERAKAALAAVDPLSRASQSEAATVRVEALPEFARAEIVLAYLPMRTEADARFLVEAARSRGKLACAPRIAGDDLEFVPLGGADVDALPRDRYGIPVPPPDARALPLAELAAARAFVAVSGLLFDAGLRRLGRGKGYYDRFIRALRAVGGETFFCGFALDVQIAGAVPFDERDEVLDAVAAGRALLR